MHKILVLGAGKIGSLITLLLQTSGRYEICLADINFNTTEHARLIRAIPNLKTVQLDVFNDESMAWFFSNHTFNAIISSLPYFCNSVVAQYAKKFNCHYFDLTEDVSVTRMISELAEDSKTTFVPQCGLAPGFVGIVANDLMQHFETINTVKLRVGALPVNSSNIFHYALTWSTDGLINQYGNLCHGILNKQHAYLMPLEDLELHEIDGLQYEGFNTSGGLGNLATLYSGKVDTMNYKTLRYPGHCEKMRFLMKDLKLNQDRPVLKRILESAIPKTYEDVVVLYVSVNGIQKGEFIEENFVQKYYPIEIEGITWTAIQITTAASLCAVVDIILTEEGHYQGLVFQEQISLDSFLENQFGKYLL